MHLCLYTRNFANTLGNGADSKSRGKKQTMKFTHAEIHNKIK